MSKKLENIVAKPPGIWGDILWIGVVPFLAYCIPVVILLIFA